MKIAILGGGSWGTALAIHLAKKDHVIKVWEFFEDQAKEMQEKRRCRLLPGSKLSDNISVSSQLEPTLLESELVLLVVPSDKVESTITNAAGLIEKQPVIICSKGFTHDLKLLSEVVEDKIKGEVYCLYGPTHAEEVCKGMFSGIVLAGRKGREELKEVFESGNLRVDLSKDMVGVQVGAALKNILAIFVGILDGMGLGDNAKAYIMTKGLEEIKMIGSKWGADEETFCGLSGMGDMIVTCTSKHSRNRHVGEEVGKGRKLDDVLKDMNMVAEGVTNLKHAIILQEKFKLDLPVINGLHRILFGGKDPKEVLMHL